MKSRWIGMTWIFIFSALTACTIGNNFQTPELIGPPEYIGPSEIQMAEVTIYFLDESRYSVGTEPYEIGVVRNLHPDAFLPRLALQAYFDGPTDEEYAQGLRVVLSSCTGFSEFSIQEQIAMVKLEGPCTSGGSTYSIAQPIIKVLQQFPEIHYVKIFDAEGNTEVPFGPVNSIPLILEP